MKKPHGFTLIEMMVVICITGILLSISIDGLRYLQEQMRATATINQLLGAVHLARHSALSRHQLVTLCPTADQKTCSNNWATGMLIISGKGTTADAGTRITAFPPLSHGRIEWRAFGGGKKLQFAATGLTFSQNGTFTYCPDDKDLRMAKALIINKAGRARMAVDLNKDGIVYLRAGEPVQCT